MKIQVLKRLEVRSQKSEVRSQKSEVRSQKSEVLNTLISLVSNKYAYRTRANLSPMLRWLIMPAPVLI